MQSANLSGPFRGCLYYALLGLPQATGLAGGYDFALSHPDKQDFFLGIARIAVLREEP